MKVWKTPQYFSKKQKTIAFIDNPVLHEGLEDTAVFLEKTKNALKNLLVLANIFVKNWSVIK